MSPASCASSVYQTLSIGLAACASAEMMSVSERKSSWRARRASGGTEKLCIIRTARNMLKRMGDRLNEVLRRCRSWRAQITPPCC